MRVHHAVSFFSRSVQIALKPLTADGKPVWFDGEAVKSHSRSNPVGDETTSW